MSDENKLTTKCYCGHTTMCDCGPQTEEVKTLEYPYPNEPLDKDGYPTEAALNYILNWGHEKTPEDGLVFGKYWANPDAVKDLVAYIKTIWTYDDAIREDDGLLEIHTFGWSGNEEILPFLKTTSLWFKYVAHQTGGHFYFRLDRDSKYTYSVERIKATW